MFYFGLFEPPFILQKYKQNLAAALHQTTALEEQEGDTMFSVDIIWLWINS